MVHYSQQSGIDRLFLPICSFIIGMFLLTGCGEDKSRKPYPGRRSSYGEVKDSLIRENKKLKQDEQARIMDYIERHGWKMEETGSGLRYWIHEKGDGKQPQKGDMVKVNYEIELLNGTVCYTSDSTGPKTFRVAKDHVETGLHEGIRLMKEGGKAKFIMPAHLAHGLLGDMKKIPFHSAIIYHIELLEVKGNDASTR